MGERKLVPKRRFEGCEGEWLERKLGDVIEVTMGHSPESSSYTNNPSDCILVQGNADIKKNKVCPRVWTTQVTKQANKEDLIITVRAPVGEVAKTEYDVVLGRGVAGLKGNDFIFHSLIKKKLDGYWTKLSTGSTFDSVNSNEIKEVNLLLPNEKEQQKIGEFFKVLDERIANQERKIAKVKALKAAYLTEMFPQEGETVPKRRFKGFEGEWDYYKLSEIANIIGGGTPSTANSNYWGGNIDWYSPVEIGFSVYANGSRKKITRLGLEKSSATVLPADRTILFTSRAGIGDMAILAKDAATNQGFQSLVVNEEVDTYFIYSMGYKIKEYALTNASGSTFLEVSGKVLGEMSILLPSKKEQQKIGNFFKNLDNQIETEEKKLDKLQKMKEAYLEEMFV